MRILVVEDDQPLVRLLRRILEEAGYAVDAALDGLQGEVLARAGAYDLIVLDWVLPGRDGVTVCRNLRADGITTPILMLTARDTLPDRVHGLDAGADDYLVKPFAAIELLARLRALSRRAPAESVETRIQVDGLVMDLIRHEVTRDGKLVQLSAREFALLEYLLRHPREVLSRTRLLADVWKYDTAVTPNLVDTYVHYLRDKIDRHARHKLIHTVRGVGYVLRT